MKPDDTVIPKHTTTDPTDPRRTTELTYLPVTVGPAILRIVDDTPGGGRVGLFLGPEQALELARHLITYAEHERNK